MLRHVYMTTISTYRLSKFSAAFITFLLSAAVHELVMLVVTKKVRLYLFLMQVSRAGWAPPPARFRVVALLRLCRS